jgi:transposase InsO family protein
VRTGNGPEFISRAFIAWTQQHCIRDLLIEPGRPVQNAYIESFNGKCLHKGLIFAGRFFNALRADDFPALRAQALGWRLSAGLPSSPCQCPSPSPRTARYCPLRPWKSGRPRSQGW